MLRYYDRILLGIAGSLFGGLVLSVFTTIGFLTGILVGAMIATMLMYHAMFRNPPLPRDDPRVTVAALAWHVLLLSLVFVAL